MSRLAGAACVIAAAALVAGCGASQKPADPAGSDTPQTVAAFLRDHHLTRRAEFLIGSRRQLERVWAAWKVGATPDAHRDVVAHSALVYGITASGRVVTVYPANRRPSDSLTTSRSSPPSR